MNTIFEHIAIIVLTILLIVSVTYNIKHRNDGIGFESALDELKKITAGQRNQIFQNDEIIGICKRTLLELVGSVRFKKQIESGSGYDEEWASWEEVTKEYADTVNWVGKTYHSEVFTFGNKDFVIKFEPHNNNKYLRGIPRVVEKEKCVKTPR